MLTDSRFGHPERIGNTFLDQAIDTRWYDRGRSPGTPVPLHIFHAHNLSIPQFREYLEANGYDTSHMGLTSVETDVSSLEQKEKQAA